MKTIKLDKISIKYKKILETGIKRVNKRNYRFYLSDVVRKIVNIHEDNFFELINYYLYEIKMNSNIDKYLSIKDDVDTVLNDITYCNPEYENVEYDYHVEFREFVDESEIIATELIIGILKNKLKVPLNLKYLNKKIDKNIVGEINKKRSFEWIVMTLAIVYKQINKK